MQKVPLAESLKIATAGALIVLWAALTFSKALTSIAVVAALILWVFHRAKIRDWRVNVDPRILGILLTLLFWVSISVFWSEARPQSFKGIQKTAEALLIFLLVADVFRWSPALIRWERSFIFIALTVILDGWFQYKTGKDFIRGFAGEPSGSGVRLSACFNTYGLFACYLISTLPLLAGLAARFWREKQKVLSGLYAAAFLLSLPLLYLTRSRGAILAAILGLLFFLLYRRYFIYFIAALLITVAAVFALPKNIVIHLDIDSKEQSLVERFYLWDRAAHVVAARPLTGTGINTYAVSHQKYDKTQNWRVKNYYAHNGYLQMAAEIGIPGLLIFLLFLFNFFKTSFRGIKDWAAQGKPEGAYPLTGICLGVLNFLILTLVDTVLHNPPSIKLFWYLCALAFAYLPSRIRAGS